MNLNLYRKNQISKCLVAENSDDIFTFRAPKNTSILNDIVKKPLYIWLKDKYYFINIEPLSNLPFYNPTHELIRPDGNVFTELTDNFNPDFLGEDLENFIEEERQHTLVMDEDEYTNYRANYNLDTTNNLYQKYSGLANKYYGIDTASLSEDYSFRYNYHSWIEITSNFFIADINFKKGDLIPAEYKYYSPIASNIEKVHPEDSHRWIDFRNKNIFYLSVN